MIQVVLERLQDEGINTVVVASSPGKTAAAFAEGGWKAGESDCPVRAASGIVGDPTGDPGPG